jgi:hypothetical protein
MARTGGSSPSLISRQLFPTSGKTKPLRDLSAFFLSLPALCRSAHSLRKLGPAHLEDLLEPRPFSPSIPEDRPRPGAKFALRQDREKSQTELCPDDSSGLAIHLPLR